MISKLLRNYALLVQTSRREVAPRLSATLQNLFCQHRLRLVCSLPLEVGGLLAFRVRQSL
jgi:hypothetical protein